MQGADYPRVTHPSAAKADARGEARPAGFGSRVRLPRFWLPPPLDLHVLGTPPAFILSHDQTLKFVVPIRPAPVLPARPPRLPPSLAGSRVVSDAPPISWGFAGLPNPKLPLGTLAFARLPLPAGSLLPSGSLIFRGYSVFKGQLASKPRAPSFFARVLPAYGAFEFLLVGFSFSSRRPLNRGERYYINSVDFVKGFFQEICAPRMLKDGAKTAKKMRENRKKPKKTRARAGTARVGFRKFFASIKISFNLRHPNDAPHPHEMFTCGRGFLLV